MTWQALADLVAENKKLKRIIYDLEQQRDNARYGIHKRCGREHNEWKKMEEAGIWP